MSSNLCYANEVRFCVFNLIQLNSSERSSRTLGRTLQFVKGKGFSNSAPGFQPRLCSNRGWG